jgi:phage-related holin
LRQFFSNLSDAANSLKETLKLRWFSSFRKSYEAVFIDDKKVKLGDTKSVDLILSPKYYWVKIETLPVKYAFQAKEYAPSLFEGYIPEGDYSYKAFKSGEKFLIFAYEAKSILESIEKLGVKTPQIHKVYFAQTELCNMQKPLKIDGENALIVRNGKVVKAPLYLAGEYALVESEINRVVLSKNSVKLGKFNRFYEQTGAFTGIVYVLIFLIAIFLCESIYLIKSLNNQKDTKADIIERYSLPSTDLQLRALLKQYDGINKKQKDIREKLSYIFKFKLQNGEYFKSIEANSKEASLVLHISNKNSAESIRNYLAKSFVVDDFKEDNLDIKIKIKYE